ncbi:MAG: TetR/AcrR family transcriptional regulator [Firmicutes bacterium]|nr:TetR/AcrR family transcriptional regulator [Bacillota bacterium]
MTKAYEGTQGLRDQQRTNILRAALHVFARHGWAATMADIAQRAQVSQGLAYRYFESKEEIFASLIAEAQSLQVLNAVLTGAGSPRDRLRGLLVRLLTPGSVEMEFYQFSMQVGRDQAAPTSLRPILEQMALRFRQALEQLIREGQTQRQFRSGSAQQLAIAVFAMINGLTLLGVRGNPDVLDNFPDADLVLNLVREEL